MVNMAYLIDLVKYCFLDKKCPDGRFAEDYVGPINVDVNYENNIFPVRTQITSKDIKHFKQTKLLQYPH